MSAAEPESESSPKLVRGLGGIDATMIVMGSMIGSGIFIVSAASSKLVGSPGWLLAAWGISGLLTVCGAICAAEVAAMMPRAGGQYVFLREAYGPSAGFLFGWSMFLVVQTGTIAAVAVAFAKFFGVIWPAISDTEFLILPRHLGTTGYALGLSTQQAVAITVIGLLTILNTRGLKTGKTIQNTFTFTKTAALIALIVVGIFFGWNMKAAAWTSSWWYPSANGWTVTGAQKELTGVDLTGMGKLAFVLLLGKAMIGPLFSQASWNAVTFTGAEIRDPGRTLPRALVIGTASVVTLYLLANVAYIVALPFDKIENAEQSRVGTLLMKNVLGDRGVILMAAAIMISTFGCINGLILSGARVMYAMARDGLFFRQVGTTNARHVPAVGLWLQGAWAILLALPMTVKLEEEKAVYGNTYGQLLDFLTPVDLTFYMLLVGSVVALRIKAPNADRPYRTFLYPLPVIFYLVVAGLLVADFIYLDPKTSGIGYAIALAGIPVYWLRSMGSRSKKPNPEPIGSVD
jgi:APA family basic amino acid/polyamine antiporter